MPIKIRAIGSNPVKITLNIAMLGAITSTLESLINQSNDKNASDDVPIFWLITQMPIKIRAIGSNPVKITLNIAMLGAITSTLESLINQSNDKNASDDVPIFCAGNSAWVNDFGNFKLNDIAAVSSWK